MQTKVFLDKLKDIIFKISKKDHFSIFREKVDIKDVFLLLLILQAPDYFEIIKNPMDLSTMSEVFIRFNIIRIQIMENIIVQMNQKKILI